jgi:hypothetical protein
MSKCRSKMYNRCSIIRPLILYGRKKQKTKTPENSRFRFSPVKNGPKGKNEAFFLAEKKKRKISGVFDLHIHMVRALTNQKPKTQIFWRFSFFVFCAHKERPYKTTKNIEHNTKHKMVRTCVHVAA